MGLGMQLCVEFIRDSWCPGQEPQVLHVVRIARVNHRVCLVVRVDDQVVRVLGPATVELDKALTFQLVFRAPASSSETFALTIIVALVRVEDSKFAGRSVKVGVEGVGTLSVIRYEVLVFSMIDLIPGSHVARRIKIVVKPSNWVTNDRLSRFDWLVENGSCLIIERTDHVLLVLIINYKIDQKLK